MTNLTRITRDLLFIMYLNRAMRLTQYEQVVVLLIAFVIAYWLEKN